MKKILQIITCALCAALSLSVLSCGSASTATRSKTPAPEWVLTGVVHSDTGYYAMGEAKLASVQESLRMATLQARGELARILNTQIHSVTEARAEYASDGTANQSLSQHLTATTDAMLENSEVADRYIDTDGKVYVLVYLPYDKTK